MIIDFLLAGNCFSNSNEMYIRVTDTCKHVSTVLYFIGFSQVKKNVARLPEIMFSTYLNIIIETRKLIKNKHTDNKTLFNMFSIMNSLVICCLQQSFQNNVFTDFLLDIKC